MLNLEPMVTAVNFIESRLQENIKVADIADAVSYSLFHFCRTFNKIVHHSPYDYLIRRRLSESARLLLETDQRITDIAFTFQFNSLETYSRAFKRLFGQLPREWKKGNIHYACRMMPRLTPAHLELRNRSDFIRYKPELREALPLTGVMSLMTENEQDEISQLWANLADNLNAECSLPQKMCYGVRWIPAGTAHSPYFYLAAVEKEADPAEINELVAKIIPAGTYGRFHCPGPFATRQLMFDYIIHTWLPQSSLILVHPFVLEHFQKCPNAESPLHWDIFVPVQSES